MLAPAASPVSAARPQWAPAAGLAPPALVHSPYSFQAYEEVLTQLDFPASSLHLAPTASRECPFNSNVESANPVSEQAQAPLPGDDHPRGAGPSRPPFPRTPCAVRAVGDEPGERRGDADWWPGGDAYPGADAASSSPGSGAAAGRKSSGQWRRYGIRVSPREALRQLQAFRPLPLSPPAELFPLRVSPPAALTAGPALPGHLSPAAPPPPAAAAFSSAR